jgi:general nucleoside transport system permease protein
MIRFEARTPPPLALASGTAVLAGAAAFAVAALPLAALGQPFLPSFGAMVAGAVGSVPAIEGTLVKAAPLMLTGLATALAFRVGLKNFGAEGQLLAGALVAIAVGAVTHSLPVSISSALALAAGTLAGALMMAGAAILRVSLGTDEAIVTVLLNVVALIGVQVATGTPLPNVAATGVHQTFPLATAVPIATLADDARLYAGLAIASLACATAFAAIRHTIVGFAVRAVGGNPVAAGLAGIPVGRVLLAAGAVSGALAGLAGAGAVVGLVGDAAPAITSGLGYAGIAVALLAGRAPLAIIPAALLVAAVLSGTASLSASAHAPAALVDIAAALTLVVALLAHALTRYRVHIVRRTRNAPTALT